MEVILKKYKITKTILQQSLRPTQEEIRDLDVLGWCVYKSGKHTIKYIILHNEEQGLLKKIPSIREIKERHHAEYRGRSYTSLEKWEIIIVSERSFIDVNYSFTNINDANSFKADVQWVMKESNEKGQFYL